MTYNEWRDELKSNLLSVSESERKRVLDYYAEAYADRREAGFSERKIIEGFGAPYDAAQKILNENADDDTPAEPQTEIRKSEKKHEAKAEPAPPPAKEKRENYGWLFVLLCIILCVPLFGLIMTMTGITIGLCVAPFALVGSGAAEIIGAVTLMAHGEVAYGFYTLGVGFISFGAGIVLFPLFIKIVKLMWKLFKTVFSAIKNAFTGKEKTA